MIYDLKQAGRIQPACFFTCFKKSFISVLTEIKDKNKIPSL
jgi:hypothetical protein